MLKLVPSSRPRYCMMLFIVLLSGSDFATRASPYLCGYSDSRMARNKCLSCIFCKSRFAKQLIYISVYPNRGTTVSHGSSFFLVPLSFTMPRHGQFQPGRFSGDHGRGQGLEDSARLWFPGWGRLREPLAERFFVAPFFAPKVCPLRISFK